MRPKNTLDDLRVAVWFLRPYATQILLIFFMLFAYAALETVSIGALYPFMNQFLGGAGGAYGGRVLDLLTRASEHIPVQDRLVATSLFLLCLVVASNILGYAAETIALWYHLKLYADQQNRIYEKILRNQYRYFLDKKQGELVYIGREAATAVGEMFFYFPKAGIELFRVLAITALLLSISVPFTLATYGLICLFGVLIYVLSVRIVHPAATRSLAARSDLMATFSESVSGIRQIKLFNGQAYCLERFRGLADIDRFAQFRSVAPAYFPPYLILCTATVCALGALIYVKLHRAAEFAAVVPTMVVYIGAIMRLMPSISKIGSHWMGLKSLGPRLRVTHDTLASADYDEADGGRDWPGLSRELRLDAVSFSYRGRRPALVDVSLTIPKNRTVAIVGESGAGKSTLVDLLMRLYHPEGGSILADGEDYAGFSRSSWLGRLGMVSQDTFIFHASIRDNIRMGDPSASDADIEAAAKVAHAHDFIKEFPEGYETVVGDRGLKLSGGQRQRIAIARAVVRNPEILVLDEATSSLDTLSERTVQEAIREAKKNRTTVIIAHRLSTIEHADVIFVLHKGRLVEQGSHEELLARDGYYRRLHQKQQARPA